MIEILNMFRPPDNYIQNDNETLKINIIRTTCANRQYQESMEAFVFIFLKTIINWH